MIIVVASTTRVSTGGGAQEHACAGVALPQSKPTIPTSLNGSNKRFTANHQPHYTTDSAQKFRGVTIRPDLTSDL
jgi:hypothetical protein